MKIRQLQSVHPERGPRSGPRSVALASIDRGVPLSGPDTIHVDVTNACNTDCITCWDHSPLLTTKKPNAWKKKRAEVADVEALLDDALSLGGLRAVILSGMGDPFVHPRIYDLISAVKARGLHLTIITNLIPAEADRVVELGVDQLLIGIHAASEGAYRAFHPSFVRDEWSRLHAMLARFQAAGRRFKHVHVVCEPNASEIVEMVRLAARYDAAQVNFKLASLRDGTEACRITEAQRARLEREWIPEAIAVAERLGVETNLDVFAAQVASASDDVISVGGRTRAGAATAPIREIGCFMGYVYSRVTVEGTVLYCCNTEVVVGSLRDARFSELWRGEAWTALRARFRRGEYFDSCSQCGKVNQNVKLARRFAREYGERRLLEVTGR